MVGRFKVNPAICQTLLSHRAIRARNSRKKVAPRQTPQVEDKIVPRYADTSPIATLVDGANTDPFDTLPIKADRHSHELVRFYLNGGSPTPITVETRVRMKTFRMKYLAPLLLDSPLSYSTLSSLSSLIRSNAS